MFEQVSEIRLLVILFGLMMNCHVPFDGPSLRNLFICGIEGDGVVRTKIKINRIRWLSKNEHWCPL